MHFILHRFCSSDEMGTFGKMYHTEARPENFICYTTEQSWADNLPNISCVPTGTYQLKEYESPTHGMVMVLENAAMNVYVRKDQRAKETDRFACLVHAANRAAELRGCIAPGLALGFLKNQWAVTSSRKALTSFLSLAAQDEVNTLKIEYKFT